MPTLQQGQTTSERGMTVSFGKNQQLKKTYPIQCIEIQYKEKWQTSAVSSAQISD